MTSQDTNPTTPCKSQHEATPAPSFDEILLKFIAGKPSGASISDIERSELVSVARRTLQRLLTRLVEEGHLHRSGQGKGTRYFVGDRLPDTTGGYSHTLVAQYRPNEDAYLSDTLRRRFRALNRALRSHHSSTLEDINDALMPKLFHYWSFDFTWHSSRLLDVGYTQREAEQLLRTGRPIQGCLARDTQAILNHQAAAEFLLNASAGVNELTLCNLHAILTDNLQTDPSAGGRLRRHPYSTEPRQPQTVLRTLVEQTQAIDDPFEQSFFLFIHLSYLRLFEHGNRRLARAAANLPLLGADLCPITFMGTPIPLYHHALHEVGTGLRYHVLRDFYAQAYEESCAHSGRLPVPGTVNPVRLKYREAISDLVRHVVHHRMAREPAQRWLEQHRELTGAANALPIEVYEVAMQELAALHLGNIYRHGLDSRDFTQWKREWGGGQP